MTAEQLQLQQRQRRLDLIALLNFAIAALDELRLASSWDGNGWIYAKAQAELKVARHRLEECE